MEKLHVAIEEAETTFEMLQRGTCQVCEYLLLDMKYKQLFAINYK